MAKTDWRFTDTVIPEDLNGIGEEINGLRTEISTRFDHEATTPLTLQPGLQVVHAEKDSRFKLGEIRGRTLVNLLGQMGSMDSLNGWRYDPDTAVLDSTDKIEGTASVKGIISNGQYSDIFYSFPYESSKRYVALGELKTYGGATARIRMVESEGLVELSSPLLSSNIFSTAFFKVPLNVITSDNTVYFGTVFAGENGSGGNMDALRIYEISDTEYQALDSMTPEQVALKYPFVPSGIIGVENPYVINTSGNLLPPFYEWSTAYRQSYRIQEPYTIVQINPELPFISRYYKVPVPQGGQTYTWSFIAEELGAYGAGWGVPKDGTAPVLIFAGIGQGSSGYATYTFTVPDKYKEIQLGFLNDEVGGTFTFKNPMLTIGPDPQPFAPQRKSMLALDTELHANPDTGADPDILFEQNGEYRKLAKWKKVVLDGSLDWEVHSTGTGFKQLRVNGLSPNSVGGSKIVTKYNGDRLSNTTVGMTLPDYVYNHPTDSTDNLYISVSSADSGWGPDYSPTQDELKAYFRGWKMYHVESNSYASLYNGTGTKRWVSKVDMITVSPVLGVVPSEVVPNWTPHNLLYRLAKETVEHVVTEGSLLLSEGDNMVEVGTGIVMRERANPVFGSSSYGINNAGSAGQLKNKTADILRIYRDSKPDYAWTVLRDSAPYGIARAVLSPGYYDQSAAHSVTYTKLDTSPVVPITGTLAANEKAQINDLTAGVAEALHGVSVLSMKKAEKDAPGWITPTLFNGAIQGQLNPFSYKKLSNGLVIFRGVCVPAVVGVFCRLMQGYCPEESVSFSVLSINSAGLLENCNIEVRANGEVYVGYFGALSVSLSNVSYLAEP